MVASNAGTHSQSSHEAHAADLMEAVPREGDGVPLSRSGVLVFAQTTQ
jgi:hypothetical protein